MGHTAHKNTKACMETKKQGKAHNFELDGIEKRRRYRTPERVRHLSGASTATSPFFQQVLSHSFLKSLNLKNSLAVQKHFSQQKPIPSQTTDPTNRHTCRHETSAADLAIGMMSAEPELLANVISPVATVQFMGTLFPAKARAQADLHGKRPAKVFQTGALETISEIIYSCSVSLTQAPSQGYLDDISDAVDHQKLSEVAHLEEGSGVVLLMSP
ncbi:unnamed protein product [Caenorhabditis auriculariae]|uniref:Uncharacterized protein n=1 Tax=Caenorhabditis auriculariae TaxID=2777116 RepID=A0A8S1I0N9_9PELO|nr:unnamed protein product [Caenorhabditis auriculariae]